MALFGTARQAKGTRQALYPENLLLTTPLAAPKLKRRQQNKSNKKIGINLGIKFEQNLRSI